MTMKEIKVCRRCGMTYEEDGILSMIPNKIFICNDCGDKEEMAIAKRCMEDNNL